MTGNTYLYTGNGPGKTTNALGLALRSLGHGHRVIVIQFLKWWENTGEYKIKDRLEGYDIYQFGRKGWHGLDSLNTRDKENTEKGLDFARGILKEEEPDLLVLDEINLAVHQHLIDVENVLRFIDNASDETDIVLTGRYAPRELVEKCEFVNEIECVKHPDHGVTREGIQY